MEVKLASVSPVSFMLASQGDELVIKSMFPKPGEYRANIGAPRESFLAFKGITKIGMIPHKIVHKYGKEVIKNHCTITKMDKQKGVILVEM